MKYVVNYEIYVASNFSVTSNEHTNCYAVFILSIFLLIYEINWFLLRIVHIFIFIIILQQSHLQSDEWKNCVIKLFINTGVVLSMKCDFIEQKKKKQNN